MDVSTPSYMEAGSSSPISSPPLSVQGKEEISNSSGDLLNQGQSNPIQAKKHQGHLDPSVDANSSDTSSMVLKTASAVQAWSIKDNNSASTEQSATAKKPRQRKKKEESAGSATGEASKPAKKPTTRKPRDPDAPPRKRAKKADAAPASITQPSVSFGPTGGAQSGSTSSPMTGLASAGNNDTWSQHNTSSPAPPRAIQPQPAAQAQPQPSNQTQSPPPRLAPQPQSRGQRFDPIRSASAENARLANTGSPAPPKMPQSPSHARASPSIMSLIDPPQAQKPTPIPVTSAPKPSEGRSSVPSSPAKISTTEAPAPSVGLAKIANGVVSAQESAKEANTKLATNGKSATSSRAPSPKPGKKKKEPPPLLPGNGLLSGSSFGKSDAAERVFAEVPNQCIVIEVPMTGQTGNYVNFIREVENKYGFDVAHPRLAEHRRRMAEMAAAGAAIESGAASADEMALDGSDIDSNADMDGMDEEAGEGTTKKKKTKRGDEYDKNDDFIDDTEQAWEEQAMASRDGYFVWSGPLIQEEDKPSVEKTEGPAKRARGGRARGGATRGESSGRGRGSGTKRGAASGGPGSRGGRGASNAAAVRKPRMTKAEQKEREAEKAAREKIAATMAKEPAVPTGIIGM